MEFLLRTTATRFAPTTFLLWPDQKNVPVVVVVVVNTCNIFHVNDKRQKNETKNM